MPKGSPELTEMRKNEILDACEKVYKEQGFQGVNIKEISSEVSMTRPAIYNYFQTKEEILLGVLVREYGKWIADLAELSETTGEDADHLADALASTLEERVVMLRIMSMNLFEIETSSRVERLAEFKRLFRDEVKILYRILKNLNRGITDRECDVFCTNFNSFLFGVYPFTHHTEKQTEAMRMIGMELVELSVHTMIREFLIRTFHGIQDVSRDTRA